MGVVGFILDKITPIWNSLPFGYYPKEYKPEIHGRYDPSRYYGPADPLGEVKLKDLSAWFGRREKGPRRVAGVISRAYWRWLVNYAYPKRAGVVVYAQAAAGLVTLSYIINYVKIRHHAHYKYH